MLFQYVYTNSMALFEFQKVGSWVHLGWVKYFELTAVTSHFNQIIYSFMLIYVISKCTFNKSEFVLAFDVPIYL